MRNAASSAVRFPFTLLCAVVGTVAAVLLAESPGFDIDNILQRLLMTAALGVPLFTALSLYGEKQHLRRTGSLIVQALFLILLVVYFFTLPSDVTAVYEHLFRFMLLVIGLHFLVAFLPFVRGKQVQGFWQYNKSLFLRFLTAALYSSVLFIGLAIALAAADHLFGVNVEEERYAQLWIIIVGLFNTWFFLAGVPDNLDNLRETTSYPKGLKIFTQFVLLPLVFLYFAILIAYEAKIVIAWNLPKGWVSQLILWYSVVGIFSLLMLYPLRDRSDDRWIKVFSRWFFVGLIPLVGMLYVAILTRIGEYGITENRYAVLAMAIGLSVVVLYFLLSRIKDIRIVPIVLCVLALLSAYGPWSASSISERSQQSRLEGYLLEHGALAEGTIRKMEGNISYDDRVEMSSIIRYLAHWHGPDAFASWLADSTMDSLRSMEAYPQVMYIAEVIDLQLASPRVGAGGAEYFHLRAEPEHWLAVSGFDHMIEFDRYSSDSTKQWAYVDDGKFYTLSFDADSLAFTITLADSSDSRRDIVVFDLADTIKSLVESRDDRNIPPQELTFDSSGQEITARLSLHSISGTRGPEGINLDAVTGRLLLGID
jgi:hypothetical protein